jgi:hypothetical protein
MCASRKPLSCSVAWISREEICSPPSDPSARRIKVLPGTQSSCIPHLSTIFCEPRKRKRELRATVGEFLIRSSSAPSRVPRIFFGLGEGLSWPFHWGFAAWTPGLLAELCVNPEIRRRRGLVSLVVPTQVITPPYYSTLPWLCVALVGVHF